MAIFLINYSAQSDPYETDTLVASNETELNEILTALDLSTIPLDQSPSGQWRYTSPSGLSATAWVSQVAQQVQRAQDLKRRDDRLADTTHWYDDYDESDAH